MPIPPDPDPDPDPITNLPPTASFSFTPQSGIYPLNVTFNAGSSRDSDGTIVDYAWDFGDGAVASGQVVHHVYTREDRFEVTLTVTDDDGASDSATGELEVFGVAPPLNLQYQRFENRNLFSIEYLYRLAWNHNPRNDQIGAKIVYYNIYRREIGQGGFSLFHTLQAGNLSAFELPGPHPGFHGARLRIRGQFGGLQPAARAPGRSCRSVIPASGRRRCLRRRPSFPARYGRVRAFPARTYPAGAAGGEACGARIPGPPAGRRRPFLTFSPTWFPSRNVMAISGAALPFRSMNRS